jgi:hypothetical protein
MSSIVCAKQTPLYFYLQVKNKPYEPTGKNAFILENDAVANNLSLCRPVTCLTPDGSPTKTGQLH